MSKTLKGEPCDVRGTCLPGRRNSKCRGPEAGICWARVRSSKEIRGWRTVTGGKVAGAKAREVIGKSLSIIMRVVVFSE